MKKLRINLSAEIRRYRHRNPSVSVPDLAQRYGVPNSSIAQALVPPVEQPRADRSRGTGHTRVTFDDLPWDTLAELERVINTHGVGLHEALAAAIVAGMPSVLHTAEAAGLKPEPLPAVMPADIAEWYRRKTKREAKARERKQTKKAVYRALMALPDPDGFESERDHSEECPQHGCPMYHCYGWH